MEPQTGPYACGKCDRMWLISDYHVTQKDPDSLLCVCGELIGSWRGSRQYDKERLFPNQIRLEGDLATEQGCTLVCGSLLRVTRRRVSPTPSNPVWLRVVRLEDQDFHVKDDDLDRAWTPQPFEWP